jgi:hypothetical protein
MGRQYNRIEYATYDVPYWDIEVALPVDLTTTFYILQETGFVLLQEDNFALLQEAAP